ncbi:MAG: M14 family metallopeptidase [Clostridiales bacterium]|nr:M14 family metallopeptidase [Clostridiales bacterium]
MIKKTEVISSYRLPVDEKLEIKRCRYMPENLTGLDIRRLPRISVVTGIHGDELEGQYMCYEVGRRISENPECLKGIVDIYPAVNPLGIDSVTRGIPNFNLDMNRTFPGTGHNTMVEYVASDVINSLDGSDLVIDCHASNIYLTELPQARVPVDYAEKLVPLALALNLDFIWVHQASTVLESTLCHSLNVIGTPCVVVELGVGMRITKEYGEQLADGVFNAMKKLKIWDGEVFKGAKHTATVSTDGYVSFLNANASGIFVPSARHSDYVKEGDEIGRIIEPLTGEIKEFVKAPADGLVFTLRDYPVCLSGSLLGRILGGIDICEET